MILLQPHDLYLYEFDVYTVEQNLFLYPAGHTWVIMSNIRQ